MLISLFRLSLFLMIVMVFAWGVSYLASDENKIIGSTIIEISGFEYSISPMQLLIILVQTKYNFQIIHLLVMLCLLKMQ